jgi:hypothetical protein
MKGKHVQRFTLRCVPMPWWRGHLGHVADHAGKMPAPPLRLMQSRTALILLTAFLLIGAIGLRSQRAGAVSNGPPGTVWIPGGEFWMGSAEPHFRDALPWH